MNQAVVAKRTTLEAIIDARRGKSKLISRFARTLPPQMYESFIANAKSFPSPEDDLEAAILRAAIEAADRLEDFHEPLNQTLNQRLAQLFAMIDAGNFEVIFPSL
ncbi:MAG: hypothetical protein NTY30_00790 [Candidatus Berkelbacteria bacterium]|nr:hypothetical protein [Candidatus Berkelbacteria bacterium]